MTSWDLPPAVRTALRERLRNQIGPGEYNRLVALHGEDFLLDAMLSPDQFPERPPAPPPQKTIKLREVLVVLLLALVFPFYWLNFNWFQSVAAFLLALVSFGSWAVIGALWSNGHHTAAVIVYTVLAVAFFLWFMAGETNTKA